MIYYYRALENELGLANETIERQQDIIDALQAEVVPLAEFREVYADFKALKAMVSRLHGQLTEDEKTAFNEIGLRQQARNYMPCETAVVEKRKLDMAVELLGRWALFGCENETPNTLMMKHTRLRHDTARILSGDFS